MPDENEKPKYRINSYEVPQEEFEKLKSTLTISKEEKWTGEIAPGKGNYYGGNEVSYEAVDPKTGKKYLYTEIDYPHKKNVKEGRKGFHLTEVKESQASNDEK